MTWEDVLTADGPPQKHSFSLQGHRTSLSLEPAFWALLKIIAHEQKRSIAAIVEEVDAARGGGLSSAVRLFTLRWLIHKNIHAEIEKPL